MKKLLLTSAIVLASASTQAATVTATLSGVFDTLETTSNFTAHALAGVYQHQLPGIDMAVSGTITYDDVTDIVSAMTITQTAAYTGSHFNEEEVTYTGMSWSYDAINNTVDQTGGSASCVDNISPACSTFGNYAHLFVTNNNGTGTDNSIMDFQNIPAGFLAGGVAPFALVNPGATTDTTFTFSGTTLDLDVATVGNGGGTPAGDAAVNGHFVFTITPSAVPVPAAAWLFGSALLGLASVARRRS